MFRLSSVTVEKTETTTADSKCARVIFSEVRDPAEMSMYVGNITLVTTEAQARSYQFNVDYADPAMTPVTDPAA